MDFEKWEGLGNDFVLVVGPVDPERARAICDRRRGVGGDGILSITDGDELVMVVLNADGSRPEMCGNGLRCVVGWWAARRGLERGDVVVRTDAGERRCAFDRKDAGTFSVGAAMGRARMGEPFHLDHGGSSRRFVPVDVGNPHAVSFDADLVDALGEIGPRLEAKIEGGTNVELCTVRDPQRIEVAVWERGVGPTQACGTGACAVAAAAVAADRAPYEAPIEVVLPGGPLSITVDRELSIHMRGPARRAFRGTL